MPAIPEMPGLPISPTLIARAEAAPLPERPGPIHLSVIDKGAATPAGINPGPDRRRVAFAVAALVQFGDRFVADNIALRPVASVTARRAVQPARTRIAAGQRWSASAWLLTRPGGGVPGTTQLGGGQAGFVVRRALDDTGDLAAYGRITAPIEGKGRELAFGFDWRPTPAPVRLIAERRFGLDDQPNGSAVGTVAGIGPTPVAARVTVEAYGQAGVVFRDEAEPYGDGFVRLARPIATIDDTRLDLGIGAWGAAQHDAHRVDIGPSVGATLSVGDHLVRASIDWRERVAGEARPLSGPALTIAADF